MSIGPSINVAEVCDRGCGVSSPRFGLANTHIVISRDVQHKDLHQELVGQIEGIKRREKKISRDVSRLTPSRWRTQSMMWLTRPVHVLWCEREFVDG